MTLVFNECDYFVFSFFVSGLVFLLNSILASEQTTNTIANSAITKTVTTSRSKYWYQDRSIADDRRCPAPWCLMTYSVQKMALSIGDIGLSLKRRESSLALVWYLKDNKRNHDKIKNPILKKLSHVEKWEKQNRLYNVLLVIVVYLLKYTDIRISFLSLKRPWDMNVWVSLGISLPEEK